jgi:AraC family transcriptional regulator, regulatory protein of adaptative response / methylphosphotriester-DNA alkyltransferase methyltransferase
MDIHNLNYNLKNSKNYEINRLERITKYISDNLQSDLKARVVAEHFMLSISSLQLLFKKYYGQSYHRCLEEIRIQKAFDLISNEGKRVQEAMYATGYKHKSTFNKAFRKIFLHSPGYYKK